MTEKKTSEKSGICYHCKKKNIVLVLCPCNQNFCIKCRYPEDHKCTFDFHQREKERIAKLNPRITSEKVNK